MRTKCAISDAFVRDCVFAYRASVTQYVYSLSAEYCFRIRNNTIWDERVRDCAVSTHSMFRPYLYNFTPHHLTCCLSLRTPILSPAWSPGVCVPRHSCYPYCTDTPPFPVPPGRSRVTGGHGSREVTGHGRSRVTGRRGVPCGRLDGLLGCMTCSTDSDAVLQGPG